MSDNNLNPLLTPLAVIGGAALELGSAAVSAVSQNLQGNVDSSWIASYSYDPGGQVFGLVTKSGKSYKFQGVPRSVATAFATASSKGQFFNSEIKGKYPFS